MSDPFSAADHRFMALALRLAARGQGRVEPNPMVGAVLVRDGRIVGQGYHRQFGAPHAEVQALKAAGGWARGATLYVTLEPCCHWGKTPPCTDSLIAAGVSRVVAAMVDPFAKVRGRGAKLLRAAGIPVQFGLLEPQARRLSAPFIKHQKSGLPYVIAKWAQSLDGCVATATGESRWISSPESRADVQRLRGRVDAIVVGIATALKDDPLLMARPDRARDIKRLAARIVLDSSCRLPLASQLVRTIPFAPLIIACAAKMQDTTRWRKLAAAGAMMIPVRPDKQGRPRIPSLLKILGQRDYTNILVEGGPALLASCFASRSVDEAWVYLAPTLIADPAAKHALAGPPLKRLADSVPLHLLSSEPLGPDLKLRYLVGPALDP